MEFNTNRLVTLMQGANDRAEWVRFLDEVQAAGFKRGSDFFPNPGGDASGMFKADCANSSKIEKAKKKYGITGFGFESQEAGSYIKESTYVVGEKVKVWMGGGKKALGEVKKIAFGDGFYFVEVAGKVVSRSLHELEPFNEKTDKLVKVVKKNLSLDEAVESALEETDSIDPIFEDLMSYEIVGNHFSDQKFLDLAEKFILNKTEPITARAAIVKKYDETIGESTVGNTDEEVVNAFVYDMSFPDKTNYEGDEFDNEADMIADRKKIINREKDNMSVDEMVDEAMDMTETEDEYSFTEDGAPDFGAAEDERDADTSLFVGDRLGGNKDVNTPNSGPDSKLDPKLKYQRPADYLLNGREPEVETYLTGSKRNEQLVGAPLDEEELTGRDAKVKFIIDNLSYMPEDSPLKSMLEVDPEYGTEWLASMKDDEIDQMYLDAKDSIESEGIDFKTSHSMDKFNPELTSKDFTEGMDPEPVMEAKSTKRFSILREDIDIIRPLVEAKGYEMINVFGELLESRKQGIINIIVEKNGRKATIVYNDNASSKPWSWNGAHFNYIQEALDTIYITPAQTLKEGQAIETRELKTKTKVVEQLLEQRRYADKTTKLSKTETQRREERSKDILKRFMGDDLMNREFNR